MKKDMFWWWDSFFSGKFRGFLLDFGFPNVSLPGNLGDLHWMLGFPIFPSIAVSAEKGLYEVEYDEIIPDVI